MVTVWPKAAVSGPSIPPNHTQSFPEKGGAPNPQPSLHIGDPKLVDSCIVQDGHGEPCPKLESAIKKVGAKAIPLKAVFVPAVAKLDGVPVIVAL